MKTNLLKELKIAKTYIEMAQDLKIKPSIREIYRRYAIDDLRSIATKLENMA